MPIHEHPAPGPPCTCAEPDLRLDKALHEQTGRLIYRCTKCGGYGTLQQLVERELLPHPDHQRE
jgi:hypothetical protein